MFLIDAVNSIKEINSLRKEIELLSKEMPNIYLKVHC